MAMTAVGTQLRRRKPAANEDEVSIPPSGFVFDLSEDLSMRCVLDRFGKLGFRHAFEVQCFARYRVLLSDDRSGKLMSKVGALVGYLLVLTSQCATGFGPVRATILTSRQPTRGALDLALGFSKEARVFNHTAVGVGGETIKAHINADRRISLNRRLRMIRQVELNDQRDMPFASRLALECRA